uniref:Uncharacterized protein n=1 Tax=Romanomermis culicivorax TaxID=13658 RepID=A0A915KQN4_ROMCU
MLKHRESLKNVLQMGAKQLDCSILRIHFLDNLYKLAAQYSKAVLTPLACSDNYTCDDEIGENSVQEIISYCYGSVVKTLTHEKVAVYSVCSSNTAKCYSKCFLNRQLAKVFKIEQWLPNFGVFTGHLATLPMQTFKSNPGWKTWPIVTTRFCEALYFNQLDVTADKGARGVVL